MKIEIEEVHCKELRKMSNSLNYSITALVNILIANSLRELDPDKMNIQSIYDSLKKDTSKVEQNGA